MVGLLEPLLPQFAQHMFASFPCSIASLGMRFDAEQAGQQQGQADSLNVAMAHVMTNFLRVVAADDQKDGAEGEGWAAALLAYITGSFESGKVEHADSVTSVGPSAVGQSPVDSAAEVGFDGAHVGSNANSRRRQRQRKRGMPDGSQISKRRKGGSNASAGLCSSASSLLPVMRSLLPWLSAGGS